MQAIIDLLKKISISTYLYVILIYLGYINYFSYYIIFDINIINYLTFGELLMSFLNLTIPFLTLIAVFLFFIITRQIFIGDQNEGDKYFYDNITDILPGSINNFVGKIKQKKWKSFSTYLFLVHTLSQIIISIIVYAFIFIFPFVLLLNILGKTLIYDLGVLDIFVFGLVWLMMFNEVIHRYYKNTDMRRLVFCSAVFLFFIGYLMLVNKSRAKNILNGNGLEKIEFSFDDNLIKTDSNLLFIGQTENYIFLRHKKDSTTLIYSKEKVDHIKINKRNID